jgi:hypothetical protein
LKSNEKRLGNLLLSSIRSNAELSPKLIDTDAVVQLIIGSKENNTAEEKKKNDTVQLKSNSVSNQSLINTTSVLPTLSYKIKNADQLYGDYLHHLLSKLSKADELDQVLFTTKIKFNINDNNIIERLKKDALLALKLLDENNFNDGSYAIKNESSIYFEGETLRPDRVLMKDQTAIIIDFKTGGQDDKHNKQVEKYCSVIEKMGFQEVKGYLLYTETNSLIPIN